MAPGLHEMTWTRPGPSGLISTREPRLEFSDVAFNARVVGALSEHIGQVPEVQAVFLSRYGGGFNVITVIPDFDMAVKEAVYDAEDAVRSVLPGIGFDFVIRLSQGRPPMDVVPMTASPIFYRNG